MAEARTPGREEVSLYNSALDNLSFSSFTEDEDVNRRALDSSVDVTRSIENNFPSLRIGDTDDPPLLDSESSDNMEVDPKSKLANKTIFKNDNPNLSIIEISDTSSRDDENSVYLIDSSDPEDTYALRLSPPPTQPKQQNHHNQTTQYQSSSQKNRKPSPKKFTSTIKPKPNSVNAAFNSKAVPATASSSANKQIEVKANGEGPTTDSKSDEKKPPRQIQVYDTLEDFENNLPPTVTVLTTPYGSKVYLVGTAHFSEESQDDVSFVIRNVRPDIVMVELCQSRIHILKHDEKTLLEEAKNINLAKVRNIINTNGFINGIFYILLLHMSAQIAKELGMAPGGEFRRAFEEVHRLPGCMLHLGDRPINITLQRALRALSLWQTLKLVWRLTSTENISLKEVEECKERDFLEKLMKEMAGEFPAFSDVFVKERDLYLCHSLQVAALPHAQMNGTPRPVKVVGVIGIGHADGIAKNWGKVDPNRIPEILLIPPVSTSTKVFKYTVKYGIIGLAVFGVFKFMRPRVRGLF